MLAMVLSYSKFLNFFLPQHKLNTFGYLLSISLPVRSKLCKGETYVKIKGTFQKATHNKSTV